MGYRRKILVTEKRDFSPSAVETLEGMGDLVLADLDRDELLSDIRDVNVLWIRLRNNIDRDVIQAAPNLQYIVTPTTGLNHIDMEYAKEQGVTVLSLRNEVGFLRNIRASSEHTLALMLALLRNIPAATTSVREGYWQRDPFKGSELHNKTVGLVGFGRIGRLVAQYLHAFGCKIIATDPAVQSDHGFPYVQFVEIEQLLCQSDIVSLHVNLTNKTEGFFGDSQFALMKNESYFINTSRGELIDEGALLEVLANRNIAGAALDVLCNEHTLEESMSALFLYTKENENLLITPHIGGCTRESMEKTEVFMAEKLSRAIDIQRV